MLMSIDSTDVALKHQLVFREVLNAFAEPGLWRSLGSTAAAVEVLDALLDNDVSLWCSGSTDPATIEQLRFRTGVKLSSECQNASFVLLSNVGDLLTVSGFAQGTSEEPEASATVLIVVADQHSGTPATLSGPGIAIQRFCSPGGVTAAMWKMFQKHAGMYPTGVDVLFCCEGQIMGMPRSTRIVVVS